VRDAALVYLAREMAVTQLLARLRNNKESLFQLFGGRRAMIESPVIQEIIADCKREKRDSSADTTT